MNLAEPMPTNTNQNPLDLDEKVLLKNKCTISGFESIVVRGQTHQTMMMGYRLNVMTQVPYLEDRANLPVGVYMILMYSELQDGSRTMTIVLHNLMGKPVHLQAGRVIAWVLATNVIPEGKPTPELMKKLDKQDPESILKKLSIEERQKLLMELLWRGGLDQLVDWTLELARKFERLLMEYHDIFYLDKNEIRCMDAAQHIIELLDKEPFKERFQRIAPPLLDEIQEHLQEMLDGGAIWPSQSAWCNAMVLIRKKDGCLRFCIDFWQLNARTKKDLYPLPQMQETMESMVRARFFSTMDLKSGFWQVKMSEKSRQYTAFTVGSMGIFEFLQMPYSLCNAPATFQRLMQNCLGELNLTYALIYLDDVIVFSRTGEDHLIWLRAVFEHFWEHGLKLKPSKCHFLRKETTFLGHKVLEEGMKPREEGLMSIAEMAPPWNYTKIRRFLGATGFFWHFIKNYTRIARPLNDLLEGEASKWKAQLVDLTLEAVEAFDLLKIKCVTTPVLAFADFEKPFLLETDASSCGLGVVLSQKQDENKYHPVAYASWELKGGEKKYHSLKLEFLALKWAMTDQFKEYLWYRPFTVRMDNNPLTYVMTTPNLDAIGHRWVTAMAGYNIEYLKGADNKVADLMSWVPEWLDPETVTILLNHAGNSDIPRAEADDPRVMEEHQRINEDVILWAHQLVKQDKHFWNLMNWNWVHSQMEDLVICHVIDWIQRPGQIPIRWMSSCGLEVSRKLTADIMPNSRKTSS